MHPIKGNIKISKTLILNFWALITISLLLFSCKSKGINLDPENDELGFSKMDSITLQLEQIKVLFPTVEQWEETGAIRFTKDSAIISDRNGEMLLEKTFTINIDATKEIKVDQQYENILTIITSGDNIDLTKLDRYVSPWQKIEVANSNKYSKKAYNIEELKTFPPISIQDVLDYIFLQTRTTQSEFDWNKYLKQSKSINEFPFDIKVSKITIRLQGEYINGEAFKKYIVFNII